jgi:hypothetical protein
MTYTLIFLLGLFCGAITHRIVQEIKKLMAMPDDDWRF